MRRSNRAMERAPGDAIMGAAGPGVRREETAMTRGWAMAFGIGMATAARGGMDLPHKDGPFQPSWESLAAYECPAWFRDAKFGIWAHWGAQCEPEDGDWYARNMYIEGSANYATHLAKFGHPSKFGFKDVCHEWKAERFDPERLIALYKKAGAQYFVAMANHHDNFDNWASKYQPWNAVAIGPKKDLVGMWEKAARAAGLRFGVTVHAARTWEWYEVAQLADRSGPLAGVPYDGNLTKADGKGLWWDGLDPQDLYAQRHKPSSNPIDRKAKDRIPGDPPSAAYCRKFYDRVIDLVDSYKPDLLYFDDGGLPLGGVDRQIGLSLCANLYNVSAKAHGGRNEAVMNTKRMDDTMRKCWILDIERGVNAGIDPLPWQTDTCIGTWHYNRPFYEKHGYKTVEQVVRMLADICSKNGNLLLNIPVRADGTIDEDEEAFLEGMAAWMAVNREAIIGTRPWKIMGEGPSVVEKGETGRHGGQTDVRKQPYTAEDFRFTTKAGALYAIAMAWPADGRLTVRCLAAGAPGIRGDVTSVELLGTPGKLEFRRTADGLVVPLPEQKPCEYAFAFRIAGLDLAGSEPVVPRVEGTGCIRPAADGTLVLGAADARTHGQVSVETRGGQPNLGRWDNAADWASWKVRIAKPGVYEVTAETAALAGDIGFVVEAGEATAAGRAPRTGSWDAFVKVPAGRLAMGAAGEVEVRMRAKDPNAWKAVNLRGLVLKPMP